MTDAPKIALTYEERQALPVIRKLLKRKPEFAAELLKDISKASAVGILLHAQHELSQLHILAKAMVAASAEIVKMEKNDAETA
jgi:hypothetical protein